MFIATIEVGESNQGPVKPANCGFWGVPETKEQIVKRGPSTLMLTSFCRQPDSGLHPSSKFIALVLRRVETYLETVILS